MITNLHQRLLNEKSPFAYAAVCALVIGLGDLIATGTDIFWLIGDMSIQVHPHHYITMVGLVLAECIMVGSFIWLYKSINQYLTKKMHKAINDKAKRLQRKHDKKLRELLNVTARN